MKRFAIARKTLREARGTTIGIAIAVGAIAFSDVLAYPSYRDMLTEMDMPELLQGFLGEATDMASAEGFFAVEFFSWAPILLIVLAIVTGTFAFAGEEAQGTLDLLLAQPISRMRLAIEKSVALIAALVIAAFASVAGYVVGGLFVEIELPLTRFTVATINMIPVGLIFLGLALLASALAPSRGSATMPVIALVVATYMIQLLGASVPAIDPFRIVSPFYWAEPSHVLLHGFDWLRFASLTAISLLFFAGAIVALNRREIAQLGREMHLPRLRSWPQALRLHRSPRPAQPARS